MAETHPATSETRCTFETMGAALRCRYSEGHAGPHIFVWIPGTPRATEVDAIRADMDAAVNLLNAEMVALRAMLDAHHGVPGFSSVCLTCRNARGAS